MERPYSHSTDIVVVNPSRKRSGSAAGVGTHDHEFTSSRARKLNDGRATPSDRDWAHYNERQAGLENDRQIVISSNRSITQSQLRRLSRRRGYSQSSYSGRARPLWSSQFARLARVGRRRYYGLPRRRYTGRPRYRGYARVNRGIPELKYNNVRLRWSPIRMGDSQGYDAPYFAYAGDTASYFTIWSGTATGGYLGLLNGIAQNVQQDGRIGSQVDLKRLNMNVTWKLPPSNPAWEDRTMSFAVRLAIIWDRQPNGVAPQMTDIYSEDINVTNGHVQPISMRNLANRDRFKILYDRTECLCHGGDASIVFQKYLKLKGRTTYSQAGAGIGAISSGALYVMCISDAADGTTNGGEDHDDPWGGGVPWINAKFRVRFTDP